MAIETRAFTEAQRMELRSHVELAGEAIAQYWPMRTFIHHNPLHGMEDMPFPRPSNAESICWVERAICRMPSTAVSSSKAASA